VGEALDPGRAKRFAASERLAHVLNRLAENDPNGRGQYAVALGSEVQTAPALLKLLLKSGHTLEAQDARALANFGDLRYRGRDVATPFWLDTGIAVPGDERPLVVPVTHSEHRFLIRGPTVNADLCFFFGVDGDAAFRPLATVDPAWTAGVIKHRYSGERALEAVRLASAIRRAYQAKSRAHPELAFGGYFPFGVCNDVNAMLELHMAKTVTLYPLTRSLRYFEGEGEVDALARRLPVDTRDAPDLKRIAQSLPVRRLRDLEFPKLRAALDVLQRETPLLADLDLFKK
jgi:hypothetical protein